MYTFKAAVESTDDATHLAAHDRAYCSTQHSAVNGSFYPAHCISQYAALDSAL